MNEAWQYEKRGEWTFRSRPSTKTPGFWLAQVVKGEFASDDALCSGNEDMWFAFGATREAAIAEVAKDVLQ